LRFRKRKFSLINKKHIRVIAIVLVLIVAYFVIQSLSTAGRERAQQEAAMGSISAEGIIRVGLRGDIGRLCTYNADTDTFEGLEKDVADEIIRRVFGNDILIRYQQVNSRTKDVLLKSGDIDISLGATLAAGTSGIVYTEPFYADAAAFLVMEGSMTWQTGLKDGTVAIVQDSLMAQEVDEDEVTRMQAYLTAQGLNTKIKEYASYPEAMEALDSGHVDGVCASEIYLMRFGKNGMLMLPERFMPHRYCIGVREDLGALSDVINETLEQMRSDGTLGALIEKWNLTDYSALTDQ